MSLALAGLIERGINFSCDCHVLQSSETQLLNVFRRKVVPLASALDA
jgi:hypothetical protein